MSFRNHYKFLRLLLIIASPLCNKPNHHDKPALVQMFLFVNIAKETAILLL